MTSPTALSQQSDDPEAAPSKGSLTLVLGGVRSGKSNFAQSLAVRLGGEHVLFVATAEPHDGEMVRRIDHHRRCRPASWNTLEQPRDVGQGISGLLADLDVRSDAPPRVILLDCLTLLVSNVMCADNNWNKHADELEHRIRCEVDALIQAAAEYSTHLIIVSGEVGSGVVPDHAMGRMFRDLLGIANQQLAAAATSTYLMVAGLAIDATRLSTTIEQAARCQETRA